MDLLNDLGISPSARGSLPPHIVLYKDTGQHVPSVIEARSPRLVDPDETLLLLVLPDPGRTIFTARNKCTIQRIQVEMSDLVCVADEGAQNVVVVQRPVHDAI